jgi:hypothetical protein
MLLAPNFLNHISEILRAMSVLYLLPTALYCYSQIFPAFMLIVSDIDCLPKLSRQLDPVRGAHCIIDKARTGIDVQYLDPFQLNQCAHRNSPNAS